MQEYYHLKNVLALRLLPASNLYIANIWFLSSSLRPFSSIFPRSLPSLSLRLNWMNWARFFFAPLSLQFLSIAEMNGFQILEKSKFIQTRSKIWLCCWWLYVFVWLIAHGGLFVCRWCIGVNESSEFGKVAGSTRRRRQGRSRKKEKYRDINKL